MERKVIFWDFDGTLIYSNESFLCSLSDAFEQFNYLFEQKEIKDFLVSVCSWYVPSKEYTDRTGELWWQELLGKLQLFCEEHHIKKSDSDLICKKFRENVISFEFKLYEEVAKCEEEKQSIKNLKELSFANSISFVLFQTTLFESVFLLQTLSLGIILPAMAF